MSWLKLSEFQTNASVMCYRRSTVSSAALACTVLFGCILAINGKGDQECASVIFTAATSGACASGVSSAAATLKKFTIKPGVRISLRRSSTGTSRRTTATTMGVACTTSNNRAVCPGKGTKNISAAEETAACAYISDSFLAEYDGKLNVEGGGNRYVKSNDTSSFFFQYFRSLFVTFSGILMLEVRLL